MQEEAESADDVESNGDNESNNNQLMPPDDPEESSDDNEDFEFDSDSVPSLILYDPLSAEDFPHDRQLVDIIKPNTAKPLPFTDESQLILCTNGNTLTLIDPMEPENVPTIRYLSPTSGGVRIGQIYPFFEVKNPSNLPTFLFGLP